MFKHENLLTDRRDFLADFTTFWYRIKLHKSEWHNLSRRVEFQNLYVEGTRLCHI
jgi:hypothetical protein